MDGVEVTSQPIEAAATHTPTSGDDPPSARTEKVQTFLKNKKSTVWKDFEVIPSSLEGENPHPKATCMHCGAIYKCHTTIDGTGALLNHLRTCKKYMMKLREKGQLGIDSMFQKPLPKVTSGVSQCSAEEVRKAIGKYVALCALPFRHVEQFGFKALMSTTCPWFQIPSRVTIARDTWQLFLGEKAILREMLCKTKQRVCLTTDTWESNQNLYYMSLTAHYIDESWCLQKKTLSFCPITSQKGDYLSEILESCISDWGIERLFTITVDNASHNTTTLRTLQRKLSRRGGLILDGEFMHMRCCAHILNLVVHDGLREMDSSILAIRNDVNYVKSSPGRGASFSACVDKENIQSRATLTLDVPTRWNSTYLMLDSAIKYQNIFDVMKDEDDTYKKWWFGDSRDGEEGSKKRHGPPTIDDWEQAKVFVRFLKVFHDITLSFSGTLYVTANECYTRIGIVEAQLNRWNKSNDIRLRTMANSMKKKFEKYWGTPEKVNPLIFVAVVLDPRFKLGYIEYLFEEAFDYAIAMDLSLKVRHTVERLYEAYAATIPSTNDNKLKDKNEDVGLDFEGVSDDLFSHAVDAWMSHSSKRYKTSEEVKTELDLYFEESVVMERVGFDILTWWKANASKYRVLSLMARDVLAIPVSTVASESLFSLGKRVITDQRCSLDPKTAESLICLQNWLTPSHVTPDIDSNQILDDLIVSRDTVTSTSSKAAKSTSNAGSTSQA